MRPARSVEESQTARTASAFQQVVGAADSHPPRVQQVQRQGFSAERAWIRVHD
ncbi:hypothetical protein [Streptomyces umbrinus]|uniref:hypothetical protein n=1 Tax=Streptomyces umbrinus TaxID=67370 RepID=UPI0033FDDCD3